MSDPIERPVFYEGQILGASDLTASLEYSRGRQARHERFEHLWGIATGLELDGVEKTTATGGVKYQEITLKAGIAIDGTGREIVVPEDEPVSPDLFDQMNVAISDQTAWYPTFLIGRDQAAQQPPPTTGACATSQPTRSVEGYEVTFGRPGDELELDEEVEPGITDPPSGGWRILLGFVQWDSANKLFKAVDVKPGAIGRRYVGIQASEVAAQNGRLILRTRSEVEAGKPALFLDDEDKDWPLQFGKLTAQGAVTSVFRVSANGDIEAEGTIKGAVTPGSVQIQSGIATDGVTLPLPSGITPEQVAQGQVTLHITLTPLLPGALPASTIEVPFECEFEKTTGRVRCRFRRVALLSGAITDLTGACNYIVLASVPAATGGQP